jgi:c-di-GMP-binding flagellar brake protein YcgR
LNTDDFTIEYTPNSRRSAFRVTYPNLFVRLEPNGHLYPVRDISASGVCFHPDGHDRDIPPKNKVLQITVVQGKDTILARPNFKCVHISSSCIGGAFIDLDRRTEALLDKLVLEIQKQQIIKKKDSQHSETKRKA